MKKIKNTELKEMDIPKINVKEGKVKNKKSKKLKDAVSKIEVQNLASKTEGTLQPNNDADNKPKKKSKKNKAIKQDESQDSTVKNNENPEVANKIKSEKKKKSKKNKISKDDKSSTSAPNKGNSNTAVLAESDLKRIEKKKAKKLAQKLKKQQKKLEKRAPIASVAPVATTNGVKNDKNLIKVANKKVNSTDNKVLTKKERKAKKRLLIKEQKLADKQTRDPAIEAATVFVGNLPVNTKRVQLIRLFKDYGPVNSIRLRSAGGQVMHKHKQRREAGSVNAYVVLKNKETAEKALSLNGEKFKDNHIRVTLSAKNPQHHEKEEAKRTVFVGNLKYSATEEALREIFSSCGEIDYVRCLRDGDKGCKGVAYVCFKTADAVGLALELKETILDDRPIHVERFSGKKLGAKEARDKQAEKEVKSKKGAKQRIDGKKEKKEKSGKEKVSKVDDNDVKKSKKSEFRGVKVEALKKKHQLKKKKKSNNQMLELAKKIAPKPKDE